jgi:hypothetical protein
LVIRFPGALIPIPNFNQEDSHMKFRVFSALAVLVLTATGTLAQTPPSDAPPKVFRIYREDVKPGMGPAHAKIEAGWPKAFAKAGTTNYYIGVVAVAGGNEALFFEPQDSFASLEKMDQVTEKNVLLSADLERLSDEDSHVLSNSRTWLATYNEDLSRPGNEPFPSMRYIVVTTYRVRPGHNAEFVEFRKLVRENQERNGAPNRYLAYNVTMGAPAGTVIVLRALKSLAELDPRPNAQPTPPETAKKLNELVAACLISSDASVYSIKPEMSHAPKEFAAADAAFWGAKPKPPSKSAVKKEAKAATAQ